MSTSQQDVNFKELIKRPVCFIGLGFGSGLAPVAPGTFGTIAAIPIYLLMQNLSLVTYLILTLIGFILGVWICERSAEWLGREDPGAVVWDEIVGYLITMIAAPTGWFWILTGFVLFRFFDIFKPWPISYVDKKIGGGLGIMLDDILAGLATVITYEVVKLFF